MLKKIFENNYYVRYADGAVIVEEYKKGLKMDIAIAKDIVSQRLADLEGANFTILVDIRNLVHLDGDARAYMASDEALEGVEAGALFVNNYLARMIGNMYLKVQKPKVPAKLFTDKGKAMDWLQSFA